MRRTDRVMGMPVTIEAVGVPADHPAIEQALGHLRRVDEVLSPFKPESDLSRLNRGEIEEPQADPLVREALRLGRQTAVRTDGFFDIQTPDGRLDPSGVVKGWAIHAAAERLAAAGFRDYFVEVAGDIETAGRNAAGEPWRVGIRNPFDPERLARIVQLTDGGIATSGTYRRGAHIYDPHTGQPAEEIISCTVIAHDADQADRYATAACAMGAGGIRFLERTRGLEGLMVRRDGSQAETTGFARYTMEPVPA